MTWASKGNSPKDVRPSGDQARSPNQTPRGRTTVRRSVEQMTVAEFYYAWVGWSSRQVELQQQAWERTRWEAWVLTSIQLEKKDRKPMCEMYPLPWDKADITPPALSIEERRERVNEMLKCIEK